MLGSAYGGRQCLDVQPFSPAPEFWKSLAMPLQSRPQRKELMWFRKDFPGETDNQCLQFLS